MPKIHSKKLIVVGDGGVGKTSLLTAYSTGAFPKNLDEAAFKVYNEDISLSDDVEVHFAIYDTPGEDDYDRLRPVLAYPNADMFIICFALNSKESLRSCVKKWAREVKYWAPMKPRILVGTKKDLSDISGVTAGTSNTTSFVSVEEAANVAEYCKASHYIECSSYTLDGLNDLFQTAAEVVVTEEKLQNRCTIL